MVEIFLILSLLFGACAMLLYWNRSELLEVIKDKEESLSGKIDRLARLEEELKNSNNFVVNQEQAIKLMLDEIDKLKKDSATILSHRKSSETKIGQITEHLAPFLDKFPHDPKETRFLGSPIDLISFDFDEPAIYFIEVKTGNSKESHRQKLIKNAIKAGRVFYQRLTVNEKGTVLKTEQNIP